MKPTAPLACLVLAALPFAASAAPIATASVKVTGGPNAGQHDIFTERGGCSTGLTGPKSFGAQISNPRLKDPKMLGSIQLDVPDRGKPNEFVAVVGFGPIAQRTASYTIDARKKTDKSPPSAIAINESGSTATVKFSGTTTEGVKIEGTIDCRSVLKAR